jgi:hypothetical protein
MLLVECLIKFVRRALGQLTRFVLEDQCLVGHPDSKAGLLQIAQDP